jgi:hypothetical protein
VSVMRQRLKMMVPVVMQMAMVMKAAVVRK